MEVFPSLNKKGLSELPIFTRFIATGFFSGYSPIAPGTAGSAVALVFFLIPTFEHIEILIPSTLIMFILGGFAAGKAEHLLGQDPSAVTVDEVVGMWLSLWFVPISPWMIGAAFLLFRLMDIIKPSPARYFDRKSGGWNIMLDDVIAGLYTNAILQVALRFVR